MASMHIDRSAIIEKPVNEEDEIESLAQQKLVENLQERWNQLHRDLETVKDNRRRMPPDYFSETCDSEEEADKAFKEYEKEHKVKIAVLEKEIDSITKQLSDNGARMMRPYEHWNEDEKLMEYLETRNDSYKPDYDDYDY